MKYDVACIGILVADVIAKPVDRIPEPGLLERIGSIETFTGGCAMSAGSDMSKIGLKTAVLGKVGNDLLLLFENGCVCQIVHLRIYLRTGRGRGKKSSFTDICKGARKSI